MNGQLKQVSLIGLREPVGELVEATNDAWSRGFIPLIAFNSDKIRTDLRRAKRILEDIGF